MPKFGRPVRRYTILVLGLVTFCQLYVFLKHFKSVGTNDEIYFHKYSGGLERNVTDKKIQIMNYIRNTESYKTNDDSVPRINFSAVWTLLDDMISKRGLYSETFDSTIATDALKYAKIEFADRMYIRTSQKWMLTVEGGQKVLFKPRTVDMALDYGDCDMGCEKPEYEVGGYTTSRMLGFLNFPFIIGRKLNWFTDILPVASERLKHRANITEDGDICFKPIYCLRLPNATGQCYEKGIIPGAMIYYIRKNVSQVYDENGRDKHPYYPRIETLERPRQYMLYGTGDDRYCKDFRQLPRYNTSAMFAYILDFTVLSYITNHRDQKPAIVSNGTVSLPVVFDFGLGFCTAHLDSYILAAPIYQCCKIRRQTFERLVQLKDTFADKFQELTRNDALYPLLLPRQFDEIHRRIKVLLGFVEECIRLKGYYSVVTDEFDE